MSTEESLVLPLWPEGVPQAKGNEEADRPDITVYPAANPTGAGILICPGGGYGCLCSSYEGHDIAAWLNRYGIAGIVLKYRLSPYRHPVPWLDVSRAMRLTRSNAAAWGLDPQRLGILGFSAGGHLAAYLATHHDAGQPQHANPVERIGSRPDFLMLVYPVISMRSGLTHEGTCENLLGQGASPTEREARSCELQVKADTPPAFLAHSTKDSAVPVVNSRIFRDALQAHHVPVTYFELTSGDHGLGCGKGPEWTAWQAAALKWLQDQKLARR